MAVKRHRCPHCGAKGYSFFATSRNEPRFEGDISYFDNDGLLVDYEFDRNLSDRVQMRCDICNNPCAVYRNNTRSVLYNVLLLVLFLLTVIMWFLNGIFGFAIPAVLTVITFAVVAVGCLYLSCYFRCLLPVTDVGNRITLQKVYPNCKVELNDTKYIRNMWVYGLKFGTETKNVKFKERFEDGLVPAQFYPSKNDDNSFEIRVIGREFVPDEVLFEGAEFLVEDIDGIFVCKGKVTKVDLDY